MVVNTFLGRVLSWNIPAMLRVAKSPSIHPLTCSNTAVIQVSLDKMWSDVGIIYAIPVLQLNIRHMASRHLPPRFQRDFWDTRWSTIMSLQAAPCGLIKSKVEWFNWNCNGMHKERDGWLKLSAHYRKTQTASSAVLHDYIWYNE